MTSLQTRWKQIYQNHLPSLAKSKDPVQKNWPVHLDHCFARIILDNAIGKDQPWTKILKQPAIKNMSANQLRDAIELAEEIATGQVDLRELNEKSLELRGKLSRKRSADFEPAERKRNMVKKVKVGNETVSKYFQPCPPNPAPNSNPNLATKESKEPKDPKEEEEEEEEEEEGGGEEQEQEQEKQQDSLQQLPLINSSPLPPFRKKVLSLLCQIPRGRYSTYGALSSHLSQTSPTCARAVGSALRNNPFAPQVPCHRILAGDGRIGGFGGSWGELGEFAKEKYELLRGEGVVLDSRGKVIGEEVFREFR